LTGQRLAYDTNILVYLEALARHLDDKDKIKSIRSLHGDLATKADCVAPSQALGELYFVLVKASGDREHARSRLHAFIDEFEMIAPDTATYLDAIELATEHKLQFWDSLILSTAASSGCSLLLSEDMQDGFAWRGVTVVNPFAKKMHKRLARVLG
jgi:predicted nucleic acid-binding protein